MALYKGSIRLAGIGSFPDQIQYMSQDDYNALSEEAKMNGTTYGIVGTAEKPPYMVSLEKFFNGGGSTEEIINDTNVPLAGLSYSIPEDCNIIYIVLTGGYSSGTKCSGLTALFTRGLPSEQLLSTSYMSSIIGFRCTADFEGGTFTIVPTNASYHYISNVKITFC